MVSVPDVRDYIRIDTEETTCNRLLWGINASTRSAYPSTPTVEHAFTSLAGVCCSLERLNESFLGRLRPCTMCLVVHADFSLRKSWSANPVWLSVLLFTKFSKGLVNGDKVFLREKIQMPSKGPCFSSFLSQFFCICGKGRQIFNIWQILFI